MPNQNLYLIDGYAQFFRAFHAIRTPMSSPVTGEPTNMTFGFVGMLLKLLQHNATNLTGDGVPTHLAVALDVSGDKGTFRSQMYPDYKANRDAPPEDLFPQVERAIEMLKAIGVPCIGSEGFEADDVIATIASTFSEKHPNTRIRIISKDKDLKQLLGFGTPPTEMYDVHTDVLITADTMMTDMGLRPDQIIDMLALMGDTSDNVPGVPGIGAKTAAALLQEFGTLDAVIAEATADKPAKEWLIKGKRRENLAASLDVLKLSKELVSLRHDTPFEFELPQAEIKNLDLEALMPFLKQLGFNRYQDELARMLGTAPPLASGGSGASSAQSTTSAPKKTKEPDHGDFGGLFIQSEPALPEPEGDYHTVTTIKDLNALARRLKATDFFAVDTETTALNPRRAKLAGISVALTPGEAYYIPTLCPSDEKCLDTQAVLEVMRPILEDESILKVGHNIKYDLVVFRGAGVHLRGLVPPVGSSLPAGDTMIASYLLDASRSSHSMDALALAELGRENISIKQLIGTGKSAITFDQVPLAKAGPYAAEDADVTLQLAYRLIPKLAESQLDTLYRDLETPLIDVLAELEFNGIEVNPVELEKQRERLQTRIDELIVELDNETDTSLGRRFDANSPKQLGGVLFNATDYEEAPGLGLKPIKKTKTGFSTDAEVLEKLAQDPDIASPIPTLMLEYRQLTKLVNTYLVNLKEEINADTGRIHASFNQTVAATGRLSSSDPNLQNIPIRTDIGREIRRAFVAPQGRTLITADYSQIELRLLAHLSKDPALTAAFHADEDIHAAVAAQIHSVKLEDVTKDQRSGAKMVNFGIVYGVTPFGLARRLGVSNTEAAEIIDGYKAKFTGITSFLAECVEFAQAHGYVQTMMGRRRPILEIDSTNPNRRSLAERMAINTVVQGSAADLIKIAMVDLHRRLMASNPASGPKSSPVPERGGGGGVAAGDGGGPSSLSSLGGEGWGEGVLASPALAGTLMLLQIHDELVFESPESSAEPAKDLIVARMEAAMQLDVPLKADAGVSTNWYEAK
ncbi:MAG: DNA polymerase-1 [Phycisphaerales bacterium]|jgi:DNA polymerase-1